jgi:predicted RNA binding protein YcfA (HicA-like mRNA interferase family)
VKTPWDVTGAELARALRHLGYAVTRQSGSHLRITTQDHGEHHEVIPNHSPIKTGTLKSILRNVAAHHQTTVGELLQLLDL